MRRLRVLVFPFLVVSLLRASTGSAPAQEGVYFDVATRTLRQLEQDGNGVRFGEVSSLRPEDQPVGVQVSQRPEGRLAYAVEYTYIGSMLGGAAPHHRGLLERGADGVWRRVAWSSSVEAGPGDEGVGTGSVEGLVARVPAFPDPGYQPTALWFPSPDPAFAGVVEALRAGDIATARGGVDEVLGRHPDVLLYRLAAIDVAIIEGAGERVRELLSAYRGDLKATGDGYTEGALAWYEGWVGAWEGHQAGTNIGEEAAAVFGGQREKPAAVAEVRAFWDRIPEGASSSPLRAPLLLAGPLPSQGFLAHHIHFGLARVRCDFLLLQGRPLEALEELRGARRMATALVRGGPASMSPLIGIAWLSRLASDYERVLLNGFESASSLESALPELDRAYRDVVEAAGRELRSLEEVFQSASATREDGEREIQRRVVRARWSLLHAAVHARLHLLKTGAYPERLPAGSDVLLNAGHAKGWVLYAVGPDGQDDRGEVEYDPTNGTMSSGDIRLFVPKERTYPFPTQPVSSVPTRDELLAQYPNGLPPDPFADSKGSSYSVQGPRAIVSSFGPDVDEAKWGFKPVEEGKVPSATAALRRMIDGSWVAAETPAAMLPYDPTNGIISDGNLYLNWGEGRERFVREKPRPRGAPR